MQFTVMESTTHQSQRCLDGCQGCQQKQSVAVSFLRGYRLHVLEEEQREQQPSMNRREASLCATAVLSSNQYGLRFQRVNRSAPLT